jgi:hypothetical protein
MPNRGLKPRAFSFSGGVEEIQARAKQERAERSRQFFPLFEIALVLVHRDHVAIFVVNANYSWLFAILYVVLYADGII